MTDDELMDRLGAIAAQADPAPSSLNVDLQMLFGLRQVDAELAELYGNLELGDQR